MTCRFKYILLPVLVLTVGSANGQFNDSVFYHLNAVASGSLNKTDDVSNFLLNNALRFGVRKKSMSLDLTNSWMYGQQQRTITNNDYTGTLNFNLYKTFEHFYYWGLGNYTTSLSLKINNQYQYGIGIAYSFWDTTDKYLNISNGMIFENSDILVNDTAKEVYNTFRNSLRVSFKFSIRKRITVSGVGFWQPSLQYSNDYIIKANIAASLKLRSWLSFTTALAFNRISRTERENLLFTYGITIDNYF